MIVSNSILVPLMMSYVTRYIYGTDKLRPNGFEVHGANGVSSGVVMCDDMAVMNQWIKFVWDNVYTLLQLQVSQFFSTGTI